LRGLAVDVCPECGRSFDPADPTTFDAEPKARRRHRRVAWAVTILLLFLIGYGVFPRGILRAKLSLTCSVCGDSIRVQRWQAKAPDWIRLRYPGIDWTSHVPNPLPSVTANDRARPECATHLYDVAVRFDIPIGGTATGRRTGRPGEYTTLNGEPVTVASASNVLKVLLAPGNNGIGVAGVPREPVDP